MQFDISADTRGVNNIAYQALLKKCATWIKPAIRRVGSGQRPQLHCANLSLDQLKPREPGTVPSEAILAF